MEAATLIESGREDHAFGIVQDLLKQDRDDAEALWLLGNLHAKAEQYTSAWLAFKRAAEIKPGQHQVLNNVGMALEGMGRTVEAREWFTKAAARAPGHANYKSNIAMTHLVEGDTERAVTFADAAIRMDPEHAGAHTCRAFALLSQGNWGAGWDDYRYAKGGKFRAVKDYGLPEWNGERDAHVVVACEQGVGDEIMYATCLPDLARRVLSVTLDCDRRTEKMFRRSLPQVTVHGTRTQADVSWLDERFTHQIMAGELPRFFRRDTEDFPGGPILAVDPDLSAMYAALVRKHAGEKRRVGLMMTGGGYHTGRKRQLGPDAFKPLIARFGATCEFFSLEYRNDAASRIAASGLPIHHFHFAVGQGADFDHTLAFVDSMDAVVGIHTTAHHAAGALGVPTTTLVPAQPSWQYGTGLGGGFPWYESVRLHRQKASESWAQCVARIDRV